MKQWWNKGFNRFVTAFLLLLLLLVSLGIKPTFIKMFGQTITVEATGWVSHDAFRGDYVQLNYKFEQVTFDQMSLELSSKLNSIQTDEELWSFLNDQSYYVTFKQVGDVFKIDQVSIQKPDTNLYLVAESGWAYYDWQLDETKYPVEEGTDREMLDHMIGLELYYSIAREYVFEQEYDRDTYYDLYNNPVNATIVIYKGEAILVDIAR